MRRAAKVDDNQPTIVRELRELGYSVQSLAAVGQGVPDILVGARGRNLLFEIKDPAKPPSRRRLTQEEEDWHLDWRGQVNTITSTEDALEVIDDALR